MGKIYTVPSGSGADMDTVTALPEDVVAPKQFVNSDSETVSGTLADASAITKAISVYDDTSLGAIGYRISKAAYRKESSGGYPVVYANKSNVAAVGGLVDSKLMAGQSALGINGTATSDATAVANNILSGKSAYVNGVKVNGAIPYQNAEVNGDRIWAISASNSVGTINVGVRNGYYLNGVNWVRYDVPTLRPENIKKGVNIGGIVGTWEGWVPTPSDLYLNGYNPSGIYCASGVGTGTDYSSVGFFRYESGQISYQSAWRNFIKICTGNAINTAGMSKIIIEGTFDFQTGVQATPSAYVQAFYSTDNGTSWTTWNTLYVSQFQTYNYFEIPLPARAATNRIGIGFGADYGQLGGRVYGAITRIRIV